jgi:hypothetical protein
VALKRRHSELEQEASQLKELFDFIRSRPIDEAFKIFTLIRESNQPLSILQSIRDANLLLHTSHLTTLQSDTTNLTETSLLKIPIKVPARPWTSVAGDGLVSELISGFFTWDTFIFGFVDQDAFLQDMRKANPQEAKHCSAFLVNAICAFRSVCCQFSYSSSLS